MALIKCEECGREISEEANVCPKCGKKTEKEKKQSKIIKKIIVILVVCILAGITIVIKNNSPIHKCSQEVINIIENYKDGKISKEMAIDSLQKIAEDTRKKSEQIENRLPGGKSSKLYRISVTSGLAAFEIEYENNNLKLNEFIEELKNIK